MIENMKRPICLICEDHVAAGELIRLDRVVDSDTPTPTGPVPVACESCAFNRVDHSSGRWGFKLYPEYEEHVQEPPPRKRKKR